MKIKNWHALALLSFTVLVAYYPALSAPFNSVDDVRLVNQLMNRTDFSWRDFVIPGSSSYFRPLINGSFVLDRIAWGMEAPLMHLENVLLHLINTLLVFAIARQLARSQNLSGLGMPIVSALLFGLHPINVEAVAWVAGRADLLAGTFVLLTLYSFWRYLSKGSLLWLLSAVLNFFLGCLAKETGLFVLPGLFLLAWVRCSPQTLRTTSFSNSLLRPLLTQIPFVAATTAYFLLRSWALQGRDLGLRHVANLTSVTGNAPATKTVTEASHFVLDPVLQKAESLITISGFYAKKLFWPFPLNFGIINVPDDYFWLGIALFGVAIILLLRRTVSGALALTAMSLGSIALLVALGDISWTPVAERYMYIPAAVLSLCCMSVVTGNVSNGLSRLIPWFSVVLLIIFSIGTFQRTILWQDNVALFADTVEKSPDFALAKNGLALALLAKGNKREAYAILRDLDLPVSQVASLNRIMVLAEEGHLEEARSLLLDRLQNPGSYETTVLIKLVSVLERMIERTSDFQLEGKYQEEALYYLGKLWEKSRNPFYLYRIGQFQLALGNRDKAHDSFAMAAELLPEDSLYREPARKLAQASKRP